jgi:hypothetical protein
VKSKLNNKELASHQVETQNLHQLFEKDFTNEYPLKNSFYRQKVLERLNISRSPVFRGGDMSERFLLPEIMTTRHQNFKNKFNQAHPDTE